MELERLEACRYAASASSASLKSLRLIERALSRMEHSRHQCLIYEGAPSVHLTALASQMKEKLLEGYCCLYFNSPTMVTGMRSYLAAGDVVIEHWIAKGSLVLTSERGHLVDGSFNVDKMMDTLKSAVNSALVAGYKGLWATGDMSWEFGQKKDFSKLLEYERRLEKYFQEQPALSGICQYHVDALPHETLQQAKLTHRSIFINETLSNFNPEYQPLI